MPSTKTYTVHVNNEVLTVEARRGDIMKAAYQGWQQAGSPEGLGVTVEWEEQGEQKAHTFPWIGDGERDVRGYHVMMERASRPEEIERRRREHEEGLRYEDPHYRAEMAYSGMSDEAKALALREGGSSEESS